MTRQSWGHAYVKLPVSLSQSTQLGPQQAAWTRSIEESRIDSRLQTRGDPLSPGEALMPVECRVADISLGFEIRRFAFARTQD